jgi:Protein of unknown function (DUF2950)
MRSLTICVSALAVAWSTGCSVPPSASTSAATQDARSTQGPDTSKPEIEQPTFASPEAAVAALYQAATAKDLDAMAHIVGLPVQDVATGDTEKDARQVERFVKAHDEHLNIVPDGTSRARVFIGKENYPLASPLVKVGDRWQFDSAGGKEELIARVIGENELATIGVCRAYVQAQYEYYAEDRNGDDVLQYAQRLASSTGQRDGLYWHAAEGEPASPLGPLIAEARAEGYLRGSARKLDEARPYHGYLFKVLTAQGANAPGGSYSYVINGRMVAGFALVAYPARWNKWGVMTFLVGANGKVWQKNLGEDTAAVAAAMTVYDPDATWSLVRD